MEAVVGARGRADQHDRAGEGSYGGGQGDNGGHSRARFFWIWSAEENAAAVTVARDDGSRDKTRSCWIWPTEEALATGVVAVVEGVDGYSRERHGSSSRRSAGCNRAAGRREAELLEELERDRAETTLESCVSDARVVAGAGHCERRH